MYVKQPRDRGIIKEDDVLVLIKRIGASIVVYLAGR
jgi:hypothetical protein